MRMMLGGLCLLLLVVPVLAQDAPAVPKVLTSDRYPVQVKVPKDWTQTVSEPTPAGNWVDIFRFTHPASKAVLYLSVQATNYRGSEEMISGISSKFQGDPGLAVLRRDPQPATSKRSPGVLFEYTRRGNSGPEHSIAAYWLHQGKRYRVYGSVREAGWKVVSQDIEAFATSLAFTSREFSKQLQNFTDEAMNFIVYFPESWTVKLPASGPRVEFRSARLGAAVRVTVARSSGSLEDDMEAAATKLSRSKATVTRRKGPQNHPEMGYPIMTVEYTRNIDGKEYRFLAICTVHAGKFYELELGVTAKTFDAANEVFARISGSFAFIK
jgi:PsbP